MTKHYQISLVPPAMLGSSISIPKYFHTIYIKQINDSEEKLTSAWPNSIIDPAQKKQIISPEETLNFYLTANDTFIDRYICDVDDAWAVLWSLDGWRDIHEYKTIELYVEEKLELHSGYDSLGFMDFGELVIRHNMVYIPQMRYRFIIDSKAEIETKYIEKLIEWETIADEEQSLITELNQGNMLMLGEEQIT